MQDALKYPPVERAAQAARLILAVASSPCHERLTRRAFDPRHRRSLSQKVIESQPTYFRTADSLEPDVWLEPCQVRARTAWGADSNRKVGPCGSSRARCVRARHGEPRTENKGSGLELEPTICTPGVATRC